MSKRPKQKQFEHEGAPGADARDLAKKHGKALGAWVDLCRPSALYPGAKVVAWALHDFARMRESRGVFGDTGQLRCWPSIESLADGCGVSTVTVRAAQQRLQDEGFLEIDKTVGGRKQTNTYTLVIPQAAFRVSSDEKPSSGGAETLKWGRGNPQARRRKPSSCLEGSTDRGLQERPLDDCGTRGAAPGGAHAPRGETTGPQLPGVEKLSHHDVEQIAVEEDVSSRALAAMLNCLDESERAPRLDEVVEMLRDGEEELLDVHLLPRLARNHPGMGPRELIDALREAKRSEWEDEEGSQR